VYKVAFVVVDFHSIYGLDDAPPAAENIKQAPSSLNDSVVIRPVLNVFGFAEVELGHCSLWIALAAFYEKPPRLPGNVTSYTKEPALVIRANIGSWDQSAFVKGKQLIIVYYIAKKTGSLFPA